MNKNSIVLLCLLFLFGLSSCGKDIALSNDSKVHEENWQEAYAAYLEDADFLAFYVGDINHDGIPEVVTRYNDVTNSGVILSFTGGSLQVLELNVVSAWGNAGYLEESNQIVLLQWYGHTQATFGSVEFYLYEWTPNGYIETLSLVRESGYDPLNDGNGEYGQGYISGEKVTFEEFEIALAEMYARLEKSTWFPMTEAEETDDYLDYLIRWETENSHRQENIRRTT